MSANRASRSIGVGTQASEPVYCGTAHTTRSGAESRSAWAAASSTATRACSEPSTPTTTTFSTGWWPDFARSARTCLSSVVSPSRSAQISGTVTVGHFAWAGSALLTEPSSRPTKPPRPRVPKTRSSAVSLISSSTPDASPFSTEASTSMLYPATLSRACLRMASAPSRITESSTVA